MNAFDQARDLLKAWIIEENEPEANRLDVTIARANLLLAIEALHQALWGYLSTITCIDLGVESGELEMLYHFCWGADILTVRVKIPRDGASVPSVCDVIPSAFLFEEEIKEMFGVDIINLPISERIFLPDDWPVDLFPLRKDADLERITDE